MRLQRPATGVLYRWGHVWPLTLRLAPRDRSKRRFLAEAPANDNAWGRLGRYLEMRLMHRMSQRDLRIDP